MRQGRRDMSAANARGDGLLVSLTYLKIMFGLGLAFFGVGLAAVICAIALSADELAGMGAVATAVSACLFGLLSVAWRQRDALVGARAENHSLRRRVAELEARVADLQKG
jgi:cell division protein FtsB